MVPFGNIIYIFVPFSRAGIFFKLVEKLDNAILSS